MRATPRFAMPVKILEVGTDAELEAVTRKARVIEFPYCPLGYEADAPYETVQIDFYESQALSPAFLAARGAGKTWAGAAKTIKNCFTYNSNALVVGPRYDSQVHEILLPAYLELIPKELILPTADGRLYHETHKRIVLKDFEALKEDRDEPGLIIYFRSGDDPHTIEGFTVGTAHLDEAGQMEKLVYDLTLGCLRHPNGPGQVIVTTTPGGGKLHWANQKWGNGTWRDHPTRKGRYITNPSPNCPAWNMIWTDNYKLPEAWRKFFAEEIDLDSPLGRQQARGEVVDFGGLIYGEFEPALHVQVKSDELVQFSGGLDRALSGVTAIVVAALDRNGRTHWVYEWGKRGADISETALQMAGLVRQYPGIIFWADPQPQGEMELETLRNSYKLPVCRADKKDWLKVGVNEIQRLLHRLPDGNPGLYIRPWLTNTIAQMQSWSFNEGMADSIASNQVQRHNRDFIDAARYATVGLMRSDRPSQIRVVWGPRRRAHAF